MSYDEYAQSRFVFTRHPIDQNREVGVDDVVRLKIVSEHGHKLSAAFVPWDLIESRAQDAFCRQCRVVHASALRGGLVLVAITYVTNIQAMALAVERMCRTRI